MNINYQKKNNESDYDYGLRLITIKIEERPDDLEWGDIVDLLHLDIHRDTLRKSVTGSPYSGYAVMKYFQEHGNVSDIVEMKKAMIQMRDERNELNKKYREISRSSKIMDIFKDIIAKDVSCMFQEHKPLSYSSDNDMVILLSDIHYGIGIDSSFNKCDKTIIQERLEQYLAEIRQIQQTHKSENCYLVLGGDLISGAIHSQIRMENIENVVTQIKEISVLLSCFVNALSQMFFKVHVYETPGNHSRLFPNKAENQKGDLLDTLVPHYLRAALQNQTNVWFYNNTIDDEVCEFEVRGHYIMGVHGDKDTTTSVCENMKKLSGRKPDVIVMAHRHTNAMNTVNDTKIVQNGCLSGTDNYALSRRLINRPEQTVFLVTAKKPVACLYDIFLS